MIDSQHPLQSVLAQLCSPPRGDGRAPVLVMLSAETGAGTSYVARHLALLAAAHYAPYGQRAALIDLDLTNQGQAAFFRSHEGQTEFGVSQGPYDATFGVEPFWQVSPDGVDDQGHRKSTALYGGLHLIGSTGLAVTEFRWSEIKAGQTVHITAAREYWNAVRDHFAVVIVDAPALDRTDIALTVVPEADKTAIICSNGRASDATQKQLSDRIKAENGRCAGLIVNAGPAYSHSQLA
jgi:Mrp family chromosome partitioning ATPase